MFACIAVIKLYQGWTVALVVEVATNEAATKSDKSVAAVLLATQMISFSAAYTVARSGVAMVSAPVVVAMHVSVPVSVPSEVVVRTDCPVLTKVVDLALPTNVEA